MLYEVLLFLCVIVLCFYYYSTKTYRHWQKRCVKYIQPIPLFGNFGSVILVRESYVSAMNRFYNSFPNDSFIGIFQGRRPALLIKNPELIKSIMIKDFDSFTDRVAIAADVKREPLLRNLSNMSGDEWRMLRQALTPAFSSSKMKLMFPSVRNCADELIAALNYLTNKTVGVQEYMTSYMIDIIGSCVFGIQISSLRDKHSEFRKMAKRIFKPSKLNMMKRYCRTYFPMIARFLNLRTFPKEIENFFITLMQELIAHRDESNEERTDFVQLLLNLRRGKNSEVMSDILITSQSFIFFLAGLETASTTLSFCLYELAMNMDIQRRLHTHVSEIIKTKRDFSYEDLHLMTYLDEVLCEVERKHPAAPITTRRCNKTYTLPGTDIRLLEGENVVIPIYAIHHDPLYYPDPDRFDPRRFMDGAALRNSSVFLTFGIGPRNCIASRFARMVMMTGLAKFIQNFQVFPCDRTPSVVEYDSRSLFLKLKGGIWLRIEER